MLKTFKGGYVKALLYLFPNIGLDETKFVSVQSNTLPPSSPPHTHTSLLSVGKFWKDIKNRQQFFIEFANNNDFDPFEPANWYSISTTQIYNTKV